MKIFGIGLSKTGTTSLAQALEILGYKVKDYPGIDCYRAGDITCIDHRLIEAHDALTDTPIPSFYRELDRAHPGSKFILTVRDSDGWLRSCKKQFTPALAAKQSEAHRQLFIDLYGTDVYEEHKFIEGYRRHVAQVLQYFKDRPSDLLIMDITAGDGWEKLCPFLGQPIPDRPFPKANVTAITWIRVEQLVDIATEAAQDALAHIGYQPSSGPLAALRAALGLERRSGPWLAWSRSAGHIESALTRLCPDIPIVMRGQDPQPFVIRHQWNHYWLVDPLGSAPWLPAGAQEICLHISLIQDGAPFMSATCYPHGKMILYGRRDKGVYLRIADNTNEISPGWRNTSDHGILSTNVNLACSNALLRGDATWKSDRVLHKAQVATAALIAQKLGYILADTAMGEAVRFDTPDVMISGISILRDNNRGL